MNKKIGLDVGDKTVGVAISDGLNITAQGLCTIERIGIRKDTGKIIDIIKENNCDTVVIGLPIMLDGSHSIQTEKVIEFKTMLENKLRSSAMTNVSIVFEDERFTTSIAEKVLIEGNVRRENRKKFIDKQAAIIILQGYLDKQK